MLNLKIRKILEKIANILIKSGKLVYLYPQEKRVIPWFQVQGDKTLRLDYVLDENSIVFDLGGYEGQWSSDIFSKYLCMIHIFEPVEEYACQIEQRFSQNPKIVVHPFGLSGKSSTGKISINSDSSSLFKNDGNFQLISLTKASEFIDNHNINKIDLMKINIEGGEYDLLEHLIEKGLIDIIKNIQVQFHDFVDDAEQRMVSIQEKLSITHTLTYQYPFVWENWKLKTQE